MLKTASWEHDVSNLWLTSKQLTAPASTSLHWPPLQTMKMKLSWQPPVTAVFSCTLNTKNLVSANLHHTINTVYYVINKVSHCVTKRLVEHSTAPEPTLPFLFIHNSVHIWAFVLTLLALWFSERATEDFLTLASQMFQGFGFDAAHMKSCNISLGQQMNPHARNDSAVCNFAGLIFGDAIQQHSRVWCTSSMSQGMRWLRT